MMSRASRQRLNSNTVVAAPEGASASIGFFIGDPGVAGQCGPAAALTPDCGCQHVNLPFLVSPKVSIPLGYGYSPRVRTASRPLASGGVPSIGGGKAGGKAVISPALAEASPAKSKGGTEARRSRSNPSVPVRNTCLDLIETSEQVGSERRRVAWGPLRRDCLRVVSALRVAGEEGRAVRMESCSREWMAFRHLPTKSVVLRANRCRDRFCLVCMALRSQMMVRRYREVIESWPMCRMMTFTVRSRADLRDQIQFLRACFKDLRRRAAWKRYVRGYIVTLEVTHSAAGWHAHLHVLADGEYWPFDDLKAEWKGVTRGEGSVDIRQGRSIKEALKYVTKPRCLAGMSEDVMSELIETMRGVRCLATGGSLRGVVTEEELDSDEALGLREEYEPIGRLDGIVERYRAGDRSADVVDTVKLALKLGILESVSVRRGLGG